MDSILTKIRVLISDIATNGEYPETYEDSNVFTIPNQNVISVNAVLVNDVELESGEYSYSTTTNKVTITATLTPGDTVLIKYSYYPNYSDNELVSYTQAALVHLSINQYYDFDYDTDTEEIYPRPERKEENLIAIIASIIINPDNKSYRLPDITINNPNKMSTSEIISRTISIFKRHGYGVFDVVLTPDQVY